MASNLSDNTAEFHLNRIIESAKLAQFSIRETEKLRETVQSKNKKIELLEKEIIEKKRSNDRENRDLFNEIQALKHELSLEKNETDKYKSELDRFREENTQLRYDLNVLLNRNAQVEGDHTKAKHIISILLSKLQGTNNNIK